MVEPNEVLETEPSESWFETSVEPVLDRCLRVLEFLTVSGIAFIVLTAAIYETGWVLWGFSPPDRQTRMQTALTVLNGNWKVGLLLLIPLFYRTVRAFLQRVEEFAGMRTSRAPVATRTGKREQPPKDDSPDEEE